MKDAEHGFVMLSALLWMMFISAFLLRGYALQLSTVIETARADHHIQEAKNAYEKALQSIQRGRVFDCGYTAPCVQVEHEGKVWQGFVFEGKPYRFHRWLDD